MYDTTVNFIDLTIFDQKNGQNDRFWSFQLVCSAHTTYSHHSNRLDQLIPIFDIILCVYSDLTTYGRIQWSELTTCGHILELNQNLRYIHII